MCLWSSAGSKRDILCTAAVEIYGTEPQWIACNVAWMLKLPMNNPQKARLSLGLQTLGNIGRKLEGPILLAVMPPRCVTTRLRRQATQSRKPYLVAMADPLEICA